MSEIRVDSIGNESNTGGPVLSGITTFSGQKYFIPPKGTTAERPSDCPPGSIRFNTDSAHLEYWNGLVWLEFDASTGNFGGGNPNADGFSTRGTGTRALFSRGYIAPGNVNDIDYITISTEGNSQDFGNTVLTKRQGVAFSSSTRSLTAGAEDRNVTIDFVTIASTGDAQDFADLTAGVSEGPGAVSNQTRAVIAGGNVSPGDRTNVMQYITMAQTGDSVDFGDLTQARHQFLAKANSSVRGVFASGSVPGLVNTIDYITISTLGDALDFGDLSVARRTNMYAESATRGIFAGGYAPGASTTMDFITIQTLGNAQDFGDLPSTRSLGNGGTSNCVRAVFSGYASPVATIEFCQIATTGNAQSFGNLGSGERQQAGASSNGHGGL